MCKNAIVISFSKRKYGNCEKICESLLNSMDIPCEIVRFSEISIASCGSCNCECIKRVGPCPNHEDMFETVFKSICESKYAVYVLPNYNHYPNAEFFAFQERCQRFALDRETWRQYLSVPKHFVVVSNSGTENFGHILSGHTARVPRILFLSSRRYGLSSITERIVASEQAQSDIAAFFAEASGSASV